MAVVPPVNFNAVGVIVNGNDNVEFGPGHSFSIHLGILGSTNAGGNREFSMMIVQAMAMALSRENPNNPAELDGITYAGHHLEVQSCLSAMESAFNAGFQHGVLATGQVLQDSFAVIRKALLWAEANSSLLRPLMAADFTAMPPLVGGGNPPRIRMSYSLLVDPAKHLYRAVTDLLCLGGYLHSAASRNATSRYCTFWDQLVDSLSTPAVANQPEAVALLMRQHGVPVQLAAYPVAVGERYPHILLRINYVGGSFPQRRAAFATYVPLLIDLLPVLGSFLQPAASEAQCIDAFATMARAIHQGPAAPSDQVLFQYGTCLALTGTLAQLPDIPVQADAMNPVGDADWRAQAAVAEFQRRKAATSGSSSGAGPTAAGSGGQVTQASMQQRRQLINTLLTMPFFGATEARLLNVVSQQPSNEFPRINIGLGTRNVIFYQILTGKLKGLSELSQALKILEGASKVFPKYIDHYTVMDKLGPLAGQRPVHTLEYNQEEFTRQFLSHNREAFLKLNFLAISGKIQCARNQIIDRGVTDRANLFVQEGNITILKYFSYYLEAYEFAPTGRGSWTDALDRIEQLRGNGLSLPDQALIHHLDHCQAQFKVLLGELFDALSHFTQPGEATDVSMVLSSRVYEDNGNFDLSLTHKGSVSAKINELVMMNPAFALCMTGGSPAKGPSPGKGAGGKAPKGANKNAAANKYHWMGGGGAA